MSEHGKPIRPITETKPRRQRVPSDECRYCAAEVGNNFFPPHDPSPRCESGKRPHCTCDVCF